MMVEKEDDIAHWNEKLLQIKTITSIKIYVTDIDIASIHFRIQSKAFDILI